jgi:AMP deaminase
MSGDNDNDRNDTQHRRRTSSSSPFFGGGGPPDPISYLRRIGRRHSSSESLRRTDSAEDDTHHDESGDEDDHNGDDGIGGYGEGGAVSMMEGGGDEAAQRHAGTKRRRSSRSTRHHDHHRQEEPARERPPPGQAWPHRDALSFTRSLIFYGEGAVTQEHVKACKNLQECRRLRQKYFGGGATKKETKVLKLACGGDGTSNSSLLFQLGRNGVVELYHPDDLDRKKNLVIVPTVEEYNTDYEGMVEMVNDGFMRSYCFQRLQLMTSAFRTHVTMNGAVESQEQGNLLGTDFFRTLKIDNHIHASGAPSAKQFVNFVKNKLETEADTVVSKDGKTLRQVFDENGLDKDHLTIDAFDVLADYSVYQRFDNFNAKYSPFRMADMRRIFLKTSNSMGGRYFAELMKLVFSRHEESKGHSSAVEMRLSIYGMEREEWQDLSEWMLADWGGEFPGPVLSSNNRWMIQVPRLWRIFRTKPGNDTIGFDAMLENIFAPMFEATLYPEKHPKVAEALTHIVGMDSVDDEGALEVGERSHIIGMILDLSC